MSVLARSLTLAALTAALLVGCGSDDKKPEGPQEIVSEEPITGTPGAPPLGSPRPKLSPGELAPKDDDD